MNAIPIPVFDMKRFLSTGLFVVATLAVLRFFPSDTRMNGPIQVFVLGMVFLLFLPMSYVMFVLREPLSSIGFHGSERRNGFLAVPIAIIPLLIVWYILLSVFGSEIAYSLPAFVGKSFFSFIWYEVLLVGGFSFLYEVFFRGLVMLSWLPWTKMASPFLQTGLFITFIAVLGGIGWGHAPILLAAIVSGFVAYHTRSIYYSWFAGWLSLFLMDVFFLVLK